MKQSTTTDAVAKYYSRLGSRLGYRLVMKNSQHFGYYDNTHTNESMAQDKYHQEFADLLDIAPGMKLLDAGCGQGVVAGYLAAHFDVAVTGITITPYEVGSAERRARALGVQDRTHFVLGDYAKLPFGAATFDRIYTTETLSHAEDVTAVLEGFYKLLKPGGKLVCAEYEFDYTRFDDQDRHDADFVKEHAAIRGMYQFGLGQFTKNLKKVGFTKIAEWDWTEAVTPSFARLARLAQPVARIVRKLGLQKHFVNTVAADMYIRDKEKDAIFYKVYTAFKKS